MTTLSCRRSNPSGAILLVVLLGGGLLLLMGASLAIPDVGMVETRPHAVERHGSDATLAREALGKGPQFNYDCPESDRRVVARFLDDGRLGIMIVGRTTGLEITSFAVSDKTWQGDLQRIVEMHKCRSPWNMAH